MLLANPYFVENVFQDQPYSSMLLIAPNCDFTCEGCQNKHLKDNYRDFDIGYLVDIYKENPFYQGITVGGLEIFLSGDKFLKDLLEFIKKAKVGKITIYTRFELGYNRLNYFIDSLNALPFLKELYVKTGNYDKNLESKIIKINNWELKLSSENQDFNKIKLDK